MEGMVRQHEYLHPSPGPREFQSTATLQSPRCTPENSTVPTMSMLPKVRLNAGQGRLS